MRSVPRLQLLIVATMRHTTNMAASLRKYMQTWRASVPPGKQRNTTTNWDDFFRPDPTQLADQSGRAD
jgi:hypothetical protein